MTPSSRLVNRGFMSLLVTQFLGAANDNILKQVMIFMVATGIWSDQLGNGGQAVPALCLTMPFIFLSGLAGQLADRFSKRSVMVVVKLVEIPIALLALVGLMTHSLWLTLASLLLLAIQSSLFGPAKFGSLPELVSSDRLSQANGILILLSNLAVILGSLIAGPLSVMFDPKPGNSLGITEPLIWAPGVVLLGTALAGAASVLWMPRLPAANPGARVSYWLFGVYFRTLAEMDAAMLTVTMAWSGFYMIAMMALMIVPEYEQILKIDYAKTSLLVGMLGISVAVGSVVTGIVSGRHIRPKLIPFGALGMAACFLALGLSTPTFTLVALLISLVGFFAGFYILPLQALLQYLSPPKDRGRFLGTAGALSFLFASGGAGLFWLLTGWLRLSPHHVHIVCGVLAVSGCVVGTLQMRRILRDLKARESAEPKPAEQKSVKQKPVEPKPVEPKPVEPKPAEPKPVEPKPDGRS